jgi:hypothetical protein
MLGEVAARSHMNKCGLNNLCRFQNGLIESCLLVENT